VAPAAKAGRLKVAAVAVGQHDAGGCAIGGGAIGGGAGVDQQRALPLVTAT
jgi:hypothetical protein